MLALDVTDPESIAATVQSAGPIDVLVNNAGIGAVGAFEATPMPITRELFETNTFGVMAMTQAVVPQMRARRSGVIVNVTSSSTLAAMPLAAVYTASKSAIEGFTGSLALELDFFGVRVKLVQPGYGPSTAFTSNGVARMAGLIPPEYHAFAEPIMNSFASACSGDHPAGRRRRRLPRRHRHLGTATVPCRCGRSGAGAFTVGRLRCGTWDPRLALPCGSPRPRPDGRADVPAASGSGAVEDRHRRRRLGCPQAPLRRSRVLPDAARLVPARTGGARTDRVGRRRLPAVSRDAGLRTRCRRRGAPYARRA